MLNSYEAGWFGLKFEFLIKQNYNFGFEIWNFHNLTKQMDL